MSRPSPGLDPARLPVPMPRAFPGGAWAWAGLLLRLRVEWSELVSDLARCGRNPRGTFEAYRERRLAELGHLEAPR